jgi:hypothetical protein
MLKAAAVAVAALWAGGCSGPPIKQEIAQCQLEAERLYANAPGDQVTRVDAYVATCMRARGYEYSAEGCVLTFRVATDDQCYRRAR